MGQNITIEVLFEDEPRVGEKVTLHIKGFLTGGWLSEFTDDSGHASFEMSHDYEGTREFTIEVCDQFFGPFEMEDGGAYTVNIEHLGDPWF